MTTDNQIPRGFQHILGIFDTSGPCILAFPPRATQLPPEEIKRIFLSGDENAALKYLEHARFRISLCYSEIKVDPPDTTDTSGKRNVILHLGQNVRNDMLDGVTFAHEAHHLLNICGSPLGHLLHMSRAMLCTSLISFLDKLRERFYGTLTSIELRSPLASIPLELINEPLRVPVEGFRKDLIEPFVDLHRYMLGQLDISEADIEALSENNGIESLRKHYSRLDALCGSRLALHLREVDDEYPPFVQLPDKSFTELGGLQLAESIAWCGEMMWLEWIYRSQFHDAESKELLSIKLDQLHSKASGYTKRYGIAFLIASKLLGDDGNFTALMFASWMALLTPVDPRTLHFVEKYKLRWADIHPGLRFIQILQILSERRIVIEDDPFTLRRVASDRFDEVARILGWPTFGDMVNAMALKHPIESSPPADWCSVFHWIENDPYKKIYDQINSLRLTNPWCDVFPGLELFDKGELRVPVILTADRVAVDPDNLSGFFIFATARIVDLLLFGECDPLVDTLFKDEEMHPVLNAICEHLVMPWQAVHETWRRLRRRSGI